MPPSAPAAPVPFLDLAAGNAPLKARIMADIGAAIDRSAFINGPAVAGFEADFARYCRARHCVGTASGLDALRLGLIAAGIEPGDEVVVPASTFVATIEAVEQAGGVPRIVDVDPVVYAVDHDAVAAAAGPRTRFILPVHLYGQMGDMRRLSEIAVTLGAEVIEDACQAHGAVRDGVRAGTAGRAAAFSFYPGKNLGAFGDAGALVTGDAQLAERVRALREHGQRRKYQHDEPGYTARLDALQAIVLSHKLPWLDRWNWARRHAAGRYAAALGGVGDLVLPSVPAGSEPVWHLFVVRTAQPDALAAFLDGRGIATGRHYPQPIHLTRAYERLGHTRGEFPVAEALASEALSLPLFPGISDAQVDAVCDGVHAYFARSR
jgi:dTDP-4-amino-4,6-dideoxygalactose transaminase